MSPPLRVGMHVEVAALSDAHNRAPATFSWLPRRGVITAIAKSLATGKPVVTVAFDSRMRLNVDADELIPVEAPCAAS